MPRVLRHTPTWLQRPAPGFALFAGEADKSTSSSKSEAGPNRTIAHRGTEVFVAVGSQLRWSDLILLREEDRDRRREQRQYRDADKEDAVDSRWQAYRVLKVPIYRDIRQLSISPSGEYIAILTTHTVHVALLPDPRQLSAEDPTPLKLKTFQIGPTAHVLERSPVVSALWHPLAASGCCLVTATEDAVLRMWELNKHNRWTFDNPSLALDLRKLANGISPLQDYSPPKYGTSIGFSPDRFDMEMATCCFGGVGSPEEDGWSSMTLWIAMRNGDLYALCPFLPSQWVMSKLQTSQMFATIESADVEFQDNEEHQKGDVTVKDQQSEWAADILQQQREQAEYSMDADEYTYERPFANTAVPALQGPYCFEPDSEMIWDITDIFAVAPTVDDEQHALAPETTLLDESRGVPVSVISVATSDGQIHICLDIADTQPRWLMNQDEKTNAVTKFGGNKLPEFLLFESIKIYNGDDLCWPMFTPCQKSRSSVYVTHGQGVSYLEPTTFLKKLEEELEESTAPNAEYRLKILAEREKTETQSFIDFPKPSSVLTDAENPSVSPAACILVDDADLGDFLVSAARGQPYASKVEYFNSDLHEAEDYECDSDGEVNALFPEETRPSYQPPQELWQGTSLRDLAVAPSSASAEVNMKQELRFAQAFVDLMVKAHRVLDNDTGRVQSSASNLFQRCQRMQDELTAQLQRVAELASRIESVLEDNADTLEEHNDDDTVLQSIPKRFEEAQSRHETLQNRYMTLKARVEQLDQQTLNEKERSWVEEIQNLEHATVGDSADSGHEYPARRYEDIKTIKEELMTRCNTLKIPEEQSDAKSKRRKPKAGMDKVHAMLERERALVEATMEKLEQLKVVV